MHCLHGVCRSVIVIGIDGFELRLTRNANEQMGNVDKERDVQPSIQHEPLSFQSYFVYEREE